MLHIVTIKGETKAREVIKIESLLNSGVSAINK